MLCLFGCTEKESTEVKMTIEEEVLSVAINFVLELKKEVIRNADFVWITNSVSLKNKYTMEEFKKKYGSIVPTELINNYPAVESGEKTKTLLIDIDHLELKYSYKIIEHMVKCSDAWYVENNENRSVEHVSRKSIIGIHEKCSRNKPNILLNSPVVFNNDKTMALIEFRFIYEEGEAFNNNPFFMGNVLIVLKKFNNTWSIVLYDDMYFGEKVLRPATQQ